MSDAPATAVAFTAAERDDIRPEPAMFFSTFPTVADAWIDALDAIPRTKLLVFTGERLAALRMMMADGRLANPKKFAHIRRELGLL